MKKINLVAYIITKPLTFVCLLYMKFESITFRLRGRHFFMSNVLTITQIVPLKVTISATKKCPIIFSQISFISYLISLKFISKLLIWWQRNRFAGFAVSFFYALLKSFFWKFFFEKFTNIWLNLFKSQNYSQFIANHGDFWRPSR